MGAACQEPLGTCFLINALSDGLSTTRRPAQAERVKKRLSPHRGMPEHGGCCVSDDDPEPFATIVAGCERCIVF